MMNKTLAFIVPWPLALCIAALALVGNTMAIGPKQTVHDLWTVRNEGLRFQPALMAGYSGHQSASLTDDGQVASGCSPWTIVPGANGDPQGPGLLAVAALSSSDAWGVGERLNAHGFGHTFAEHWDGTHWSIVDTPQGGSNTSYLEAVAAVSSTDVWAVGSHNGIAALSEHWDGTRWTIVPTPHLMNGDLHGVAALSSHDVWAVGSYFNNGTPPYSRTLIEHWDGHAWSVVPSPNPGPQDDALFAITALGRGAIWAVGLQAPDIFVTKTLVEQWDGMTWHAVSSPNPDPNGNNALSGASEITPRDVWSVGKVYTSGDQTLIEHWNGQSWRIVPGASITTTSPSILVGVAAASPRDVWTVGAGGVGGGTLTEHWDGARWTQVPSPDPGALGNTLSGVARVPGTDQFWAVGYDYTKNLLPHPLILHTNGCGSGG